MVVNYNAVLNQFSSTAVVAFGVCCRVTGFFYAIVGTLCNSTIPILSYNHGTKNKRRINLAVRYGYIYALCLMAVGTVLCMGFPEVFLWMFNATDDMIASDIVGRGSRIGLMTVPIAVGKIANRTRELIRMVCTANEVEIIAGHVGKNHIHLLVSVPPHLSASKLVQYIKRGLSTRFNTHHTQAAFSVSDAMPRASP
ncbi:hypothetical protein D1841_07545 [Neglecta sp. X4]|uniref:transposase n=1 Tax=unclassified Neglectibacter TaxID=2632164 RepID=UPI00136F517D|nr:MULTISPECIES: transposase [unclassified Neglectibacter]NBI17742.1 hypothetical protein [Neglectibacter sp. 59]NBJ73162.1 hypothetical protein [Neglectibacter sp. X4]NCE81045.1 hypothetical protein [Neglectibacter sp. X58]